MLAASYSYLFLSLDYFSCPAFSLLFAWQQMLALFALRFAHVGVQIGLEVFPVATTVNHITLLSLRVYTSTALT